VGGGGGGEERGGAVGLHERPRGGGGGGGGGGVTHCLLALLKDPLVHCNRVLFVARIVMGPLTCTCKGTRFGAKDKWGIPRVKGGVGG